MQALKTVVIAMGLLLIVGVTVLVYLIVSGAGKSAGGAAGETGVEPMRAPASVGLQEGERLVEMRPDGPRLYLHIDGPDGARILVLESQTGAPLGEIDLSAP